MKDWLPIIGAVLVLAISAGVIISFRGDKSALLPSATPSPAAVEPLTADKYPQVKLVFSSDAHYVMVNLANLHADQLEYNLIYDAMVKKSKLQTGVNSTADIRGKSTFSQRQLLGSESSGKFTYHESITNAVMELTLRDAQGRSIYTATYPFTVQAGKTVDLTSMP